MKILIKKHRDDHEKNNKSSNMLWGAEMELFNGWNSKKSYFQDISNHGQNISHTNANGRMEKTPIL